MEFMQIQSFEDGEWETQDIVAWMPLPQPFCGKIEVAGCDDDNTESDLSKSNS
jgi:hypothetical protein